jgi:hypothetical protein
VMAALSAACWAEDHAPAVEEPEAPMVYA